MAGKKFLDDNGLLYYNQKIQLQLGGKLDKNQGTVHGGKFIAINESSGLLEPKELPEVDLSHLVVKVNTPKVVYGTDDGGAQTTYPVNSLGLVDDVLVDGTSVVTDKVAEIDLATPLSGKQNSLTTAQLTVINANPFTTSEKNKLASIENYVESITAGTPNVVIGGTPRNPTIAVSALEMPDEFTSTETPIGSIGTALTGMDATALTPIITGATLSLSDIIIFANNIQAVVSNIDEDEYDAVITRIPAEVSFAGITGDPRSNALLDAELDGKQDILTSAQQSAIDSGITATKVSKLDGIEAAAQVNVIEGASLNGVPGTITNKIVNLTIDAVSSATLATALSYKLDVNLGDENSGKYLQIDSNGDVSFSDIVAITNAEIDAIMAI